MHAGGTSCWTADVSSYHGDKHCNVKKAAQLSTRLMVLSFYKATDVFLSSLSYCETG